MDQQRRSAMKFLAYLCSTTALPATSWAKTSSYPGDTPVSAIVPYGAGGSTDYMGRVVIGDIGTRNGGKFVTENKAGASGNIGTRFVSTSPPDGHTLLYSTATPFSVNPFIYKTLPYDPDNGFAYIGLTVQVPLVLVAPKDLGVESLQELIDYLRKNEASSSYSSYGIGTSSHIANATFVKRIGAPGVLHVPYKDSRAMPDLAAGRNTFQVDAWSAVAPLVQAGKLVVLGVCGPNPLSWLPNVPTIASVLKDDYDVSTWHAVFAPKATPVEILDFLNEQIRITMAKKEIQEAALSQGFVVYPYKTRAETQTFVQQDKGRWKRLINEAGIERM